VPKTVRDIMEADTPTVAPEDSVEHVLAVMREHELPGVPVVNDGGRCVGIVTEADLIQREASVEAPTITTFLDAVIVADAGTPFEDELRRVVATTARDLMSSPVISIRDIATVTELATLILQERINPIPVVDQNRQIIGLATRSGVVELIARLENVPGSSPASTSA